MEKIGTLFSPDNYLQMEKYKVRYTFGKYTQDYFEQDLEYSYTEKYWYLFLLSRIYGIKITIDDYIRFDHIMLSIKYSHIVDKLEYISIFIWKYHSWTASRLFKNSSLVRNLLGKFFLCVTKGKPLTSRLLQLRLYINRNNKL